MSVGVDSLCSEAEAGISGAQWRSVVTSGVEKTYGLVWLQAAGCWDTMVQLALSWRLLLGGRGT